MIGAALAQNGRVDDRSARLVQFAVILAVAVLLRCPAWGEWNFGIDDQFYALAGERLAKGDLLYVDFWDRKGPLLYLIFTGMSFVCRSMLFYQIATTVWVALGAYGVNRLAARIGTPTAALLCAITYLALLSRFEGDNMQAGAFFNTFVIAAVCVLASRLDLLRQGRIDALLVLGFLSAGCAIAIKQTAAFEGMLLGLIAVFMLWRSGSHPLSIAWRAALLALAGAAPMLATGLVYWSNGHFADLWNAMVTSNFARGYADPGIRVKWMLTMVGMLGIPFFFAGIGLHALRSVEPERRPFVWIVGLWALVALALIFAFPNIYVHYAQSALAPLAILCAGYFAHRRPIWPGLVALVGLSLVLSGTFHLADRWRARPAAEALVEHVRAVTPGKRLLVWGAPSYLYSLIDTAPPSALAFAPHFYEGREWSGRDRDAELRRVLSTHPETIVAQTPLPATPLNETAVAMVDAYAGHCRRVRSFTIYDHNGEQVYRVFSACS
ncbi:hypothetical protein [Novosphingobium kaempferiae]|uniref:hypothetical protein n=1 Tax=Novosphingobium kaempferiae TaxID=2896849 RepID=UPI001E628068|nr:hypothetical protein [Novosphingobium kaempferiae]